MICPDVATTPDMVVSLITAVFPPSDRKSRQGRRPSASRNLVCGNCLSLAVIAFALVSGWFGHHRGGADALSCLPCEPQQCPNTTDCPGGLVMGVCMCCQECARQVNESCGGPFGTLGTCDRNLHCLVSAPVYEDGLVYANEDGICQEIPELNCQGNSCPTVYQERLCPPDSYISYKTRKSDDIGSGETNLHPDEARDSEKLQFSEASIERNNFYLLPEETSYCACNTSLCHVPVCAQGYTATLVQNATGLPGTCCDVYQCEKPIDCNAVICPVYEEDPCPDDSVRLPSMWTHDKCCELQHGCTCPTEDKCKPVECPEGYQVQVTSRATGLPGSCCHIFRCINESVLTCIYNHQEYANGQIWQMDNCKTCECKDGLNKCTRKNCEEPNCSWMMVPEGECCPVCRGCVSDSGQVYNESEVWKENDCTTCTCKNGHPQCQSEMCEVPCLNPISVPGQCCPDCPHEKCQLACPFGLKSDVEGNPICECKMAEDRCPTKNEEQCGKKCEYGFKRSRDGCIKCKCNKCPQFNCTKRCTHGHVLNDEGCPLCKCKDLAFPELISPRTEIEGMSCLSRQGSRHENGESWNDGCRVCYCHNGVEMCSLIACPAPHCSNPVFEVGDCCPTCPGLTIVSPNGEKELCQSSQGHYYVEGETWKMDPCTLCVCHGGSILCQTPTCPPVLCHHPVKPEGQCCATCRGEDLNTLPVLGHHHCRSSTSMMYKHGDVWRSTPCQSCTCQDGQIHCYSQMCPPINCNRTVLKKGQCCPTCVGE
ncbi:unnamed protein product [Lymnaea stagnalis]|uniref:Cysteine-rich motor neuron 1 protein n=1 Tax=Lymnaea stagnalis TaxID=6523 RepID=A0AAV2ID38_LYMST